MSTPIIPGAESISILDGSNGGVLLLHGYMGTVQTIRSLALAFSQAGFAVEAPLLPGHGTSVEDMANSQWSDYFQCAEASYRKLAEHHQHIIMGGLCTGATIAALLAGKYPETTAGMISINGFFHVPKHWNTNFLQDMVKTNRRFFPWWRGKVIEDPDAPTLITYEQSPIMPLLSLKEGRIEVSKHLNEIQCPIQVFTSKIGGEFTLDNSQQWFNEVAGPVEHVLLEHSNHVATLDYDKGIIEERSIAFALAVSNNKHDQLSQEVA
jgi:carboxylesterase